jgi:cytochrome c6
MSARKSAYTGCSRYFIAWLLFFSLAEQSYAADSNRGEQLYKTHCSMCHGESGAGAMPDAPNFAQNESLIQPDPLLLASIKQGKNVMPAYQGILNDQDLLDVIAYLRTFNN